MVCPPLACQMSETSTLPPFAVPQCEMISSPWYEVSTAAWAACVSRCAARALAGRLAFGDGVPPAGTDAVTSCGDALTAVWPLHAVTRKPGTATASTAVSSASRRRFTGQLNANTRTSRLRGGRVGHRRPGGRAGERNLPGGDGVLDAIHLHRRRDPGPGRRLAAAARGEGGRAQADDERHGADYQIAAADRAPGTRAPGFPAGFPPGFAPVCGPRTGRQARQPTPGRQRAAGAGHGDQPAGHGRFGRGPGQERAEFALQRPEFGGFGAALLAAGQVSGRAIAFGPVEFAVDQGRQPVTEMAHDPPDRFSRGTRPGRRRPWPQALLASAPGPLLVASLPGASLLAASLLAASLLAASTAAASTVGASFLAALTVAASAVAGLRCSSAVRSCARPR